MHSTQMRLHWNEACTYITTPLTLLHHYQQLVTLTQDRTDPWFKLPNPDPVIGIWHHQRPRLQYFLLFGHPVRPVRQPNMAFTALVQSMTHFQRQPCAYNFGSELLFAYVWPLCQLKQVWSFPLTPLTVRVFPPSYLLLTLSLLFVCSL